MEPKKLRFACFEDTSIGLLIPKDVHLFYYDICADIEMGQPFIYSWDKDVEEFIAANNLIIDDCVAGSIPSEFTENVIFFTIGDEYKGNKAAALFHHLRDAFAHYRIGVSGEYLCMKDYDDKKKRTTMIGKIHRQLFKELMDIFFEQKAKIENNQ
jgi:hypothetical protein